MAIQIDLPGGGYLLVLDPMPLFPGEGLPLYEGQPRRADGRFDFGKMAGDILSISYAGGCPPNLVSGIYDDALKYVREKLCGLRPRHPDAGDFIFPVSGLRHALRTCPMKEKTLALGQLDKIVSAVRLEPCASRHIGAVESKIWIGSTRIRVSGHVFKATVFLETNGIDGITRFHHLRLDRSDKSRKPHE